MASHPAFAVRIVGSVNLADQLNSSKPIAEVRAALIDLGDRAWIVGGTVRDLLAGRSIDDVDLAVDGDAETAARQLAAAVSGSPFSLSDEFGCWRVIGPHRAWQADICPIRGNTIEDDLKLRDFTVNAMAVSLTDTEIIDPKGGLQDLSDKRLRGASDDAFRQDPLRALRLARLACEYALAPVPETVRLAGRQAPGLRLVSGERVFYELRRLVICDRVMQGLEMMDEVGATAAVLPELDALKGVEQTPYHHCDAYDHTLEVLEHIVSLEGDSSPLGENGPAVIDALRSPVGDDLDAGQALRFAALFHDLGKSRTRAVSDEGRVTFVDHDRVGKEMCADICDRLHTGRRLRRYLKDMTLHHLRLGFLVHDQPLSRRDFYRYITLCEPVALEVTVLTVADRLATRGARTKQKAIDAHLKLAQRMLREIFEWRARQPIQPLVRGDELAEELSLERGPMLGQLLHRLDEARFAGEIGTREEALALAPTLLEEVKNEQAASGLEKRGSAT